MAGDWNPDRDLGPGVAEPFKTQSGVIQDIVDGYLVPVDPIDDLRCDGCQ
jgi:hypothetical protein